MAQYFGGFQDYWVHLPEYLIVDLSVLLFLPYDLDSNVRHLKAAHFASIAVLLPMNQTLGLILNNGLLQLQR